MSGEKEQKTTFFLILHRSSFVNDARSQYEVIEVRMQAVKHKGQADSWLSVLAVKHLLKAFPRNDHRAFLSFFLREEPFFFYKTHFRLFMARSIKTFHHGGPGMLMEEGAGDYNSSESHFSPHQTWWKAGQQWSWWVLDAGDILLKFIRDGRKGGHVISAVCTMLIWGWGCRPGMRNGRCYFFLIRLISDSY